VDCPATTGGLRSGSGDRTGGKEKEINWGLISSGRTVMSAKRTEGTIHRKGDRLMPKAKKMISVGVFLCSTEKGTKGDSDTISSPGRKGL